MTSTRKSGVFMKGSVLQFPVAVNAPFPDPPPNTPVPGGARPAVVRLERNRPMVLRQLEETEDARIVARRHGVKVADVVRLAAKQLKAFRKAA